MRGVIALLVLFVTGAALLPARADVPHPPLEAYGELPGYRLFALSPDGEHAAFVTRRDGRDLAVLYTRETDRASALLNIDKLSVRDLFFADNDHVIVVASDTARAYGFRGKWEDSGAFSVNIKSGKNKVLLRRTDGIYPAQTGLGDVVGRYEKKSGVFMPAYYGRAGDEARFHLFAVDLDSGLGRIHKKGLASTRDWFVDKDGTVIAREDYSNERDLYRIWTYKDDEPQRVYETHSDRPPFSLIGVKPDKSALILVTYSDDTDEGYSAVFEMGFDGSVSAPVFSRPDADIDRIFMDSNRFVLGVGYSGNLPSYSFYDPEVDAAVQQVIDGLPGAEVEPVAWSEDWQQIVYSVFGMGSAGTFLLQDRTDGSFMTLATSYPDIPPEAIGDVSAITYPATDGLTIPAILTWPAGSTEEARKNLPLVVMPHGGPARSDSLGFDWMAQYYANRGYLVLQPNFRGSTGFGGAFRNAGDGEWGGKMQDDITDGVNALVSSGMVDPDRVCIVGASYGGYAALAGGAFTPDLYKCVVAIAPVTDLPAMLRYVRSEYGGRHWLLDYWKSIMHGEEEDKDKLDRISPIGSAAAFSAPVLLIHGRDDTVVPIGQSRSMEAALKRAGKDVKLVELKAEDHWLSDGDTRIMTLQAMGDFVDRHIGAKN